MQLSPAAESRINGMERYNFRAWNIPLVPAILSLKHPKALR